MTSDLRADQRPLLRYIEFGIFPGVGPVDAFPSVPVDCRVSGRLIDRSIVGYTGRAVTLRDCQAAAVITPTISLIESHDMCFINILFVQEILKILTGKFAIILRAVPVTVKFIGRSADCIGTIPDHSPGIMTIRS